MIKILFIVFILAILVNIVASLYFYNIAIARTKKDFLSNNDDLETTTIILPKDSKFQWFGSINFKDVEIISDDGLKLHGYFIEAEAPTKKTAILAHGYVSKGKDMISYAKFYHDKLGYNILMPDDRGHGKSEGSYVGFGWSDRKDYLKWIDYIISIVGKDSEIVLHGVSMGGATVLMTSGENLPDNVKAIVSDCAYTSVKDQLEYQLKKMYHLPSFPVIQSTSLLTKIRAGYFFSEASALEQVAKSKTPTLFIHGDADTFVPYEMVNRLYEKCASEKDIFIVPNARHATAYRDDVLGYETKVTEFISKYVCK
ncbi:alpha/beta hydrolase [uncultured Clostridium sp.]|uniref:alpha/beta hydrolase n=1 Tax=uncultured Clostridium sp. TaxID=59620 RepID=UPI0028EA5FBB|nr:alpha/beta hydrolase [uncultured Clostridium sp.]